MVCVVDAHHLIGDAADEIRRNVHLVDLGEATLDLAQRHIARIHGHDLVVKASEATLVLAEELWHESAFAVTAIVDAHGADVSQHRLGALAVAVIGRPSFRLGLSPSA